MYKQGDMVEVEWYDAADHLEGWQDIEEVLIDPPTHPVKTIGYFLKMTDTHIYMTPTLKDEEMAVLSLIPQGCVIEITLLSKVIKYEGNISCNTSHPAGVTVS